MKKINSKLSPNNLSEEHIKQICRFTKTEYVQGEYQKWKAFAEFKWQHLKEQQERDKFVKNQKVFLKETANKKLK